MNMEYFKENVEVVVDEMWNMKDNGLISGKAFESIFYGLVDTRESLLDDDYIMDYIYKIEHKTKSTEKINEEKIESYFDTILNILN